MERKAVKTSTIIALLLMSTALMANASTQKTSGTVHASNPFSTSSAPPPVEWNQTYGGARDDKAYAIVQTSDGGYALAGYTNSFGAGGYDFWLVKTDSAGNVQWSQTYGGAGDDEAYAVVQTSDGGYALAGYTNSSGAGGYDFWLVKTFPNGTEDWSQTYGGPGDDYARSVVQTSDGGYAIAGYANETFGHGGYDFWLVKTFPNGTEDWDKPYGGAYDDRAYSLVQTSDGGYALAGYTKSYDLGLWNFWLVKTDSNGNKTWDHPYGRGPEGDDVAYSLVQTSDGGYAVAGSTFVSSASSVDFWLVKTNSNGIMQWNQTYAGGAPSISVAYSLYRTSDGGYALAGSTDSFGASSYDFWLVKTDSNGTVQWNQTYGGTSDDEAYSVVQTSDGGYALAGYTKSYGAGGYDFYLVKARLCTLAITIQPPAGGTTNTTITSGNATFTPPDTYYCSVGTVVTVSATPNANYVFNHWTLDGNSNTSNPINVTMNADNSLQAFFTPTYTLTITATAGGTTNPPPGTYINTSGTVVTVNATPYANYLFDHWTLGTNGIFVNSTTNPKSVAMDANHSLQAFFTPSCNLTIIVQPLTGGTTNPASGTHIYPSGTVINVTAFPNIGYYLDDWQLNGSSVGALNSISITMNTSYTLKAVFLLITYKLTTTVTAGGTTSPSGTGIYTYGTVVNITASPNSGCYFDHWELDGVNVGAANPINITMYNDHALHAVFESGPSPAFYTLNITATAGGTTSPPPGTYIYSNETVVNVTAWPNATYCLDQWELDDNNIGATNPMNVTMDMDHTLYAVIVPHHDVAVTNVARSKIVVFQGFSASINVTVANQGDFNETFDVTAYANVTAIQTSHLTLTSQNSTTLTFTWNTTGFAYGNYTISAYAWPVLGETNQTNNNLTDGWIVVSMAGDLTGGTIHPLDFVPDGKVDGKDIATVAYCFGSAPGCPPPYIWNANCDVNNDAKVDGKDIALVAADFGQAGP